MKGTLFIGLYICCSILISSSFAQQDKIVEDELLLSLSEKTALEKVIQKLKHAFS
jgi:hypothetical protein